MQLASGLRDEQEILYLQLMRFIVPLLLVVLLLSACGGENIPQRSADSMKDSTPAVQVPQFDISGNFNVRLNDSVITAYKDEGGPHYRVPDAQNSDTLYFQYEAATACEECRLETQIWCGGKYVDLVRDTGYGNGDWTKIPVSNLIQHSAYGTASATEIALYLSVRQYHPVETGNKRFLCYVDLE